jgi:hypothetical protein
VTWTRFNPADPDTPVRKLLFDREQTEVALAGLAGGVGTPGTQPVNLLAVRRAVDDSSVVVFTFDHQPDALDAEVTVVPVGSFMVPALNDPTIMVFPTLAL